MISPAVATYGICLLIIVCSSVMCIKSMLKIYRRVKLHGLPEGVSIRMMVVSNVLAVIGLCASELMIVLSLFRILH